MFRKLLIWSVLFALLLGTLSVATAATPPPPKPAPQAPDDGLQVRLDASGGGIQSVGSSTLANVTPAYLPIGTAFDLCFTVYAQSPDVEYMDHFDADLPDGWTVNSVAPDSVPPANGCSGALPPVVGVGAGNIVYWQSTGYPPQTGCGGWNGGSGGTNFDFCTNVTIPDATGAPWTLPWYYVGDGYGGTPHDVSGSYGPIEPEPPIVLRPELIEEVGCPCGLQEHELLVGNSAGYDTFVNLSYTLVSGTGHCSGPPSVFVPDGGNAAFTVRFVPAGQPGDTVACEVYAEDASDPANNDTSAIVKHLEARFFDPAGWQLEPIAGATPNQWAGGVVGFHPAAAGPVGYVVGGLAAGSSVINPDLQMYDPGTGTWTQLADLPNPRFSPAVGWIGGLLYAAGGYDTLFAATGDLQVYDPGTNTWDNTTPPDMPVIRGGGAGGVGVCASGTGPCLFHVGGGPDSNFASTTLETWQYDPATNAWTQLDNKPAGSSPDGHILGAGVGCMGHIYVGGDYRGFDEFFRLDATQPAGSQWTQLANMPAGAGSMTPALVCKEDWGQILLIGGDPDGYWGTYNTTVYVYDIATDTWHGPLPQTLHVGQLGSVGWHLYDRVWTAGGTVGSGAIDPMPFESLLQVMCDPALCDGLFEVWKDAPPTAEYGDVISYTVTILPQGPRAGLFMADPLPAGTEYAGNLGWTAGNAWYSDTVNTVFWEYAPPPRTAAPAAPAPRLAPDPAAAADLAGGPEVAGAPAPEGVPIFHFPKGVLWDNGPLVTHPGECDGMDASHLQDTSLGMNTYGLGHQFSVGNRMADDFAITDPLGWQIDQITFFAYQTNAPVTSTITGVYYQIWDGPPNDPASNVVFGSLAANRLITSTFTNIQRDLESSPCANNRYIMADVASAGVWLPQGIYWLDWMTDGSLASGPWAPPVTILGQTTTGNALQYTTSSGAWGPANDSGTLTQQGMPFLIEGDPVPVPEITFDVTVTAHCGDLIVNEGLAASDLFTKTFAATTTVVGDALIAVSPSPLEAGVCPDSTGVEILTICNEGDCPLAWEVHEMTPTLQVAGTPLVPQITLPDGAPQSLTEYLAAGQPAFTVQPVAPNLPAAAPDSLTFYYDRGTFDTAYPGLPVEGYENGSMPYGTIDSVPHPLDELSSNAYFDPGDILPGIQFWATADHAVGEIAMLGEGFMGNPSKTALANWFVDSYRIVFDPPVQAAGMDLQEIYGSNSCQVDIYGPFGYLASDASACDAAGVFWGVASDAVPIAEIVITSLGGGAEGADNIAFSPMTYPDIPWISQDPISGTVPRGECQDVEVAFDTTGLVPGDYTVDLLILSNDLSTPAMTVGVDLTVLEAVYGAAFTWAPLEVVAGVAVDFGATVGGGSPPFTYNWDFGDEATGSGITVSHVYAEAGTYVVELTVENACGTSIVTDTLTVEPGTVFVYLPIVVKNY
ncbi:MAG: PKD domain-containing protein [Anaerolineae bacterium]|nr:PKD domain-containing protein [Anaerolineae bacterium]